MIKVNILKEYDESIIQLCENIGKLSLPIYYKSDDMKKILDLEDSVYTIYTVEYKEKIVGFAITALTEEGGIHIMSIACHPDYRRKNLGTALLDKIKKDNKNIFISLYVQYSNENAKKFYIKNGFVEIEKVSNYYDNLDDNDAILMIYIMYLK